MITAKEQKAWQKKHDRLQEKWNRLYQRSGVSVQLYSVLTIFCTVVYIRYSDGGTICCVCVYTTDEITDDLKYHRFCGYGDAHGYGYNRALDSLKIAWKDLQDTIEYEFLYNYALNDTVKRSVQNTSRLYKWIMDVDPYKLETHGLRWLETMQTFNYPDENGGSVQTIL